MSYEQLCMKMYEERIERKSIQQNKRDRFRQSVLNKQNKAFQHTTNNIRCIIEEQGEKFNLVMPEILPIDENKLKYLIFQNLELIQKVPERKKEAQLNIKRIKDFINEQKKQPQIST